MHGRLQEEVLALCHADGTPTGTGAPRSVVRRDNLRHATVAVLVRDASGRVYVHRRTDTKDVYPGQHDAFAAGCVQLGEPLAAAAARELEEELGVTGVPLERLLTLTYVDAVTDQVSAVYAVRYDGPVVHQATEIAWGGWMPVHELWSRLADPDWPFVPDGRVLLQRLRADRLL